MSGAAPADWDALAQMVAARGLSALGGVAVSPDEAGLPPGTRTLVLLGPGEPGFWARVSAAPEFGDGAPDPLDRWSRRVIGGLACEMGGKALFPFTGPPFRPFLSWALRTGRLHASPVGMLVHPEAGLWVSLRGALALKVAIAPPPALARPCDTCAGQPCRTACPVDALRGGDYDVAACRDHIARPEGTDCMDEGCRARRACPISARYPRDPAQSAFHMRAFNPPDRGA